MTDKEVISRELIQMGEQAVIAAGKLSLLSSEEKNKCLLAMADAMERDKNVIIKANEKDIEVGRGKGLSFAMLDRLTLTEKRFNSMVEGLRFVANLDDPVGRVISTVIRPNGLKIEKVSVPIGVIGIVYESRPNVTVDAAGLCFKAGNAVILRGGSEAVNSNKALAHCLIRALVSCGLPEGIIQIVPWTDREAIDIMLKMDEFINLIIPRGGEGLIRRVTELSTIPVIKHYKGVCHIFIDDNCKETMASDITINAKCQRPGVCNAMETLLIHKNIVETVGVKIIERLRENGVELRGDEKIKDLCPDIISASEEDWYTEYLDMILSVKVVENVEEAVEHINKYGSHHSDAIITENSDNAHFFMDAVDSSTVYVNASTRFTDGGEFGMGAEIGISTDKLHARGPMGLNELTTYKYYVYGDGQIRT